MGATARFAYDEVPYDTEANPDAHPRSLAAIAHLFGLEGAPPSRARVLEIGCGNGEHLIAAASYLPEARFVGFDLAERAVLAGMAQARASGVANVELAQRDVTEARTDGASASYDYVIAHGLYSWVPEAVGHDVLAVIRASLAPAGVGFVSFNALPGWELRRALRMLARHHVAEVEGAAAKVAATLTLFEGLARAGEATGAPAFAQILGAAATEYRKHIDFATPPDAPFSHYLFHDLLADCNTPFSTKQAAERMAAAGLRVICETSLRAWRAHGEGRIPPSADGADGAVPTWLRGLADDMAWTGTPFLQLMVCRDDEAVQDVPDQEAVLAMHLWADFARAQGDGSSDTFRTSTGALFRPAAGSAVERAVRAAPGFVPVRELADDDEGRTRIARELFAASCEGVLSLVTETPPTVSKVSRAPRVAPHVRTRATEAVARHAVSAVLTSALHRSFHVPFVELAVIQELDGSCTRNDLDARVAEALEAARTFPGCVPSTLAGNRDAVGAHVDTVLDRFARYAFLVG